MSASAEAILGPLGLAPLLEENPFVAAAPDTWTDRAGSRQGFLAPAQILALHRVLAAARPGAWHAAMKACGVACGRRIAAVLDHSVATLGQPALSALPLEACLCLLERTFALRGWGRLELDLTAAASHGLVVAHLAHSCFVEVLADADGFVDPMPAGILQAFFEHISGQDLGCEEIACARRGAARCTFVITDPARLARITPHLGREPAEALLARLRA
jgi:predicted hydrocarbon binding protein